MLAAITLLLATSFTPGSSAAALFQRGDFPGAAALYADSLRSNPSDLDARLGLASIRLFQNDLAAAKPLLQSVLASDAQNPRATRMLAELERREAEAARRTTIDGSQSVVPFVTADPLPVVRANVNGIAANLLIDTGGDVDLEPSLADKAGVTTVDAGMGNFAGGLRAPTRRGMLKSLALGSAVAYDVPVHVFPTHAAALFSGTQIDGVVGTTYLERFLATIDYRRDRLVLRPRSPSDSAAFQARAAGVHDAIVPCYLVGDHFVFAPAQVNGAGGLFLFDSGLAGGGLMPSTALLQAAGIPIDQARATTGYGGGGAITAIPFVADRVAVGTALQHDVPGIYTPQGSPFTLFPFTVWGAISHEFLKHYAFTIDFDAMKIDLEAVTGFSPSTFPGEQPSYRATALGRRAERRSSVFSSFLSLASANSARVSRIDSADESCELTTVASNGIPNSDCACRIRSCARRGITGRDIAARAKLGSSSRPRGVREVSAARRDRTASISAV